MPAIEIFILVLTNIVHGFKFKHRHNKECSPTFTNNETVTSIDNLKSRSIGALPFVVENTVEYRSNAKADASNEAYSCFSKNEIFTNRDIKPDIIPQQIGVNISTNIASDRLKILSSDEEKFPSNIINTDHNNEISADKDHNRPMGASGIYKGPYMNIAKRQDILGLETNDPKYHEQAENWYFRQGPFHQSPIENPTSCFVPYDNSSEQTNTNLGSVMNFPRISNFGPNISKNQIDHEVTAIKCVNGRNKSNSLGRLKGSKSGKVTKSRKNKDYRQGPEDSIVANLTFPAQFIDHSGSTKLRKLIKESKVTDEEIVDVVSLDSNIIDVLEHSSSQSGDDDIQLIEEENQNTDLRASMKLENTRNHRKHLSTFYESFARNFRRNISHMCLTSIEELKAIFRSNGEYKELISSCGLEAIWARIKQVCVCMLRNAADRGFIKRNVACNCLRYDSSAPDLTQNFQIPDDEMYFAAFKFFKSVLANLSRLFTYCKSSLETSKHRVTCLQLYLRRVEKMLMESRADQISSPDDYSLLNETSYLPRSLKCAFCCKAILDEEPVNESEKLLILKNFLIAKILESSDKTLGFHTERALGCLEICISFAFRMRNRIGRWLRDTGSADPSIYSMVETVHLKAIEVCPILEDCIREFRKFGHAHPGSDLAAYARGKICQSQNEIYQNQLPNISKMLNNLRAYFDRTFNSKTEMQFKEDRLCIIKSGLDACKEILLTIKNRISSTHNINTTSIRSTEDLMF